eukprot:IDg17149t1
MRNTAPACAHVRSCTRAATASVMGTRPFLRAAHTNIYSGFTHTAHAIRTAHAIHTARARVSRAHRRISARVRQSPRGCAACVATLFVDWCRAACVVLQSSCCDICRQICSTRPHVSCSITRACSAAPRAAPRAACVMRASLSSRDARYSLEAYLSRLTCAVPTPREAASPRVACSVLIEEMPHFFLSDTAATNARVINVQI